MTVEADSSAAISAQGGMGGKNDEGRKSEDRRRVVERPMPNTEPVFGEVRRETRRRRESDKKT